MATVILQARMGSTRFPGKVIRPIQGKPMLLFSIQTLQLSPVIDRIVIATTQKAEDDQLAELASQTGVDCFRGSELDVLDRFYQAARKFQSDYYFRATGDNPILDYENPKRILNLLIDQNLEYTMETGMPIGSVVEAFSYSALERCHREAQTDPHREHVTLYMKESGTFRLKYLPAPPTYHYPELRLTVDYPEDFTRAQSLIEHLYKNGIPHFSKILSHCREQGWI